MKPSRIFCLLLLLLPSACAVTPPRADPSYADEMRAANEAKLRHPAPEPPEGFVAPAGERRDAVLQYFAHRSFRRVANVLVCLDALNKYPVVVGEFDGFNGDRLQKYHRAAPVGEPFYCEKKFLPRAGLRLECRDGAGILTLRPDGLGAGTSEDGAVKAVFYHGTLTEADGTERAGLPCYFY